MRDTLALCSALKHLQKQTQVLLSQGKERLADEGQGTSTLSFFYSQAPEAEKSCHSTIPKARSAYKITLSEGAYATDESHIGCDYKTPCITRYKHFERFVLGLLPFRVTKAEKAIKERFRGFGKVHMPVQSPQLSSYRGGDAPKPLH